MMMDTSPSVYLTRDIDDYSSIPELVKQLSVKLTNCTYDCSVCTDPIASQSPRWACCVCHGVFHLSCIDAWCSSQLQQQAEAVTAQGGRNGVNLTVAIADSNITSHNMGNSTAFFSSVMSIDRGINNEEKIPTFRCPLCQGRNSINTTKKYMCFCKKTKDPIFDPLLVPGSCGQPCESARKDEKCEHLCPLLCHPGPCPECPRVRLQSCYCKANEKQVGCSSGIKGYECGEICGNELNCGRHYCQVPCHSGPCERCQEVVVVSCFCGENKEAKICSRESGYSCHNRCKFLEDCGNHRCTKKCHDGPCSVCLRHPKRQHSCPCGKAPLWQIYSTQKDLPVRQSCLDLIPTCSGICGLPLPCGNHYCSANCHDDVNLKGKEIVNGSNQQYLLVCETYTCPPCSEIISLQCRCGSSQKKQQPCFVTYLPRETWVETFKTMVSSLVPPEFFSIASLSPNSVYNITPHLTGKERDKLIKGLIRSYPFTCEKFCNTMLSCGKHQCEEICCPDAGQQPCDYNGSGAASVSSHVCLKVCKKKANCKIHECGQLCHRGPCPPCSEFSTDPLYCRCRKSVIDPPVHCGTKPPRCNHPCTIRRPCGHPSNHTCHPDQGDAAEAEIILTKQRRAYSNNEVTQHKDEDEIIKAGCPQCTVPVEKRCPSHNTILPFFHPCHLGNTVSCGRKCEKFQTCCGHVCMKICHVGECPHECAGGYPSLGVVVKRSNK